MKPRYIDPTGLSGLGAVALKPPFLFREVTARVFPLKANMGRLAHFVDQQLNMDIPDTIVHFTPALPYVYFMVLNYGGLSPISRAAQHTGWIAQHEVTFTILLHRWQRNRDTGRLDFQGWASVSPFIFVDDPMSQTTGREVYGWPKVLAHIDADTPLWAAHPRAGARLFSLSTEMFRDVYAGEAETSRILLQVERDPIASYAEYPPNLRCPWSPTSVVPNLISNSLSLLGDALDIAGGLRLRGFPPGRSIEAVASMASKAVELATKLATGLPGAGLLSGKQALPAGLDPDNIRDPAALPSLLTNTINLKQYRDPESPNLACYTAIVNACMGVDRVNQFGLLGDWDLLRGDPSGGFKIRLHRYTSQPIIETLGLELAGSEDYTGRHTVSTLKPTFPFWLDVDLYYGAGEVICSRTTSASGPGDLQEARWMDESTGESATEQDRHGAPIADAAAPNAFNTALGAATQTVVGPFEFPDVTLQVYPLLADADVLKKLVDEAWNKPFRAAGNGTPPMRLKTLGHYVYMVVSVIGDQHGTMWSANNNVGWWAQREVSFCIPVAWYQDEKLISVAMIEPFVYANHGRAVVTDREVNGRSTVVAHIDSPHDVWTTPDGPAGDRYLLHLATEIFAAYDTGQRARQRTLIEVDQREVSEGVIDWQAIADDWGRAAVADLKRKTRLAQTQDGAMQTVKALALELLAHQAPVNRLTMKQYRDAADMDLACYQAAVLTERAVTRVYDAREIEQRVHVRIDQVPGHPIVEALGLKVKSVTSRDGRITQNLQPIRPFWMRVAVREKLGQTIGLVRIQPPAPDAAAASPPSKGDPLRTWCFTHPWFRSGEKPTPYFASSQRARVGLSLIDELADGRGRDLRDRAETWLRRSATNQLALAWSTVGGPDGAERLNAIAQAAGQPHVTKHLEALAALRDPAAFRPFCDALTARDAALCADVIEAALPPARRAARPAASPARRYGDMSRSHTDLPLEAWYYSPEWAAYVLSEPEENVDRNERRRYASLFSEVPSAGDTDSLLDEIGQLIRWIMTASGSGTTTWSDLISAQAKFSVWNLLVARHWMAELNNDQLALLRMTLPASVMAAKAHLLAHMRQTQTGPDGTERPLAFHELQNRQDEAETIATMIERPVDIDPAAMLRDLANGLLTAVYDWKDPERWQRQPRDKTGEALTALSEIQLVIESILSDEWGSQAAFLRSVQPYTLGPDGRLRWPKRPAHSIPVASVGPLGKPPNPWGEVAGLERWPEAGQDDRETWEFVVPGYRDTSAPQPGDSAAVPARAETAGRAARKSAPPKRRAGRKAA
ncbi:MAG: hypothetical protein JSS43_12730, partial [Proteobacteria bacterium]|nr:hypothetical protein [Pseudomonadota bacterium]